MVNKLNLLMILNEAIITKEIRIIFRASKFHSSFHKKIFSKVSTSKGMNKISRIILNPLFPDLHFFKVMLLNAFMIRDDIIYPQLPYFKSI